MASREMPPHDWHGSQTSHTSRSVERQSQALPQGCCVPVRNVGLLLRTFTSIMNERLRRGLSWLPSRRRVQSVVGAVGMLG